MGGRQKYAGQTFGQVAMEGKGWGLPSEKKKVSNNQQGKVAKKGGNEHLPIGGRGDEQEKKASLTRGAKSSARLGGKWDRY